MTDALSPYLPCTEHVRAYQANATGKMVREVTHSGPDTTGAFATHDALQQFWVAGFDIALRTYNILHYTMEGTALPPFAGNVTLAELQAGYGGFTCDQDTNELLIVGKAPPLLRRWNATTSTFIGNTPWYEHSQSLEAVPGDPHYYLTQYDASSASGFLSRLDKPDLTPSWNITLDHKPDSMCVCAGSSLIFVVSTEFHIITTYSAFDGAYAGRSGVFNTSLASPAGFSNPVSCAAS